ncbi:MAG: hypothetical protein RMI94_08955 [Bryobacterales bacterium]|nr:hypothetical protein [Bryobacteraceae bacterium]MDW8130666.1 hypothetical protein [Bryobacterales bacterium]
MMNPAWFNEIASVQVTTPAFAQLSPRQANLPHFMKRVTDLHW